jgi:hypothetical protein
MKLVAFATVTTLLLGASAGVLTLTDATTGSIAGYTQIGNMAVCSNNATIAAGLMLTGGAMEFDSDSLSMCAQSCDCRQGCQSFTWYKPATFSGSVGFFLPAGTASVGEQGKCWHFMGPCQLDAAGSANKFAFTKTTAASYTDNRALYPRTGAPGEKEVTDQLYCVLKDKTATGGYVQLGDGGAYPGVCASGGGTAKLTNLDLTSGGDFATCKGICDASADCKMFNLDTITGVCKFRKQRCQTSWVTGTAQPYTSYIKKTSLILDTVPGSTPTSPGSTPTSPEFSAAGISATITIFPALIICGVAFFLM